MYFQKKLYVRNADCKPAPFQVFNPETLEEIKPEEGDKTFEPKEGDERCLKWKELSEETGRSLEYTPLITDGQLVYVISIRGPSKKQNEEAEAKSESKNSWRKMVVEVYDPAKNWEFVREVILMSHDTKEHYDKHSKDMKDWMLNATWACNGQFLVCFKHNNSANRRQWDLKTGAQVAKTYLDNIHTVLAHNTQTNIFTVKIDGSDIEFARASLKYFKSKELQSKSLQEIKQGQEALLKKDDEPAEDISRLNVIERLIRNVTNEDLIKNQLDKAGDKTNFDQVSTVVVLILKFLNFHANDFRNNISDQPGAKAKDII
jgi:hypothetical protein